LPEIHYEFSSDGYRYYNLIGQKKYKMKHVFLSYLRENFDSVKKLKSALEEHDIKVWLDKEKIKPGKRWAVAIEEAIRNGDFFIACFSSNYSKRSETYMNEELDIAIQRLKKMPIDRAWFIPVLLSKCTIPNLKINSNETLRSLQWVELYKDWNKGINQIIFLIKNEKHEGGVTCCEVSTENSDKKSSNTERVSIDKISLSENNELLKIESGENVVSPINSIFIPKGTLILNNNTHFFDSFYTHLKAITKKDYHSFVLEDGYSQDKFWMKDVAKSLRNKWKSQYYEENIQNMDDSITGISYSEANAFCHWKGIKLPTILQLQVIMVICCMLKDNKFSNLVQLRFESKIDNQISNYKDLFKFDWGNMHWTSTNHSENSFLRLGGNFQSDFNLYYMLKIVDPCHKYTKHNNMFRGVL